MRLRHSTPAALALAALVVAVYSAALPGAFHYDDFHSIVENPALAYADFWTAMKNPRLFSGMDAAMYRPLTLASLAAQIGGQRPEPAPLIKFNIAVHAMATLFLFGAVLGLSRSHGKALLAAAVFGLHPLQTQAVNYISCRSSLLAGCFSMLAMLFLAAALRAGRRRYFIVALAASMAAFVLALLSKSEAFGMCLVPLILLAVPPGPDVSLRGRVIASAGFMAAAAAYLLLRSRMGVEVMVPDAPVRPVPLNLVTGVRVIKEYLLLAIWPLDLSVVRDLKASAELADPRALASALVLALPLALFVRARRSRPLLLVGYLWFIAGLLPTTTLAPLRAVMAEHRAYIGMAGLAILASELVHLVAGARVPDDSGAPAENGGDSGPAHGPAPAAAWSGPPWRRRAVFALAALVILAWSALSADRSRDWRSELSLWTAAVHDAPGSAVSWANHGVALWVDNKVKESRSSFEMTLFLDPRNLEAAANLARIYMDSGRLDEGIMILESVLKEVPAEPSVHYNLGVAYDRKRMYRRAELHYSEALRYNSGHINACERLAALYVYRVYDPGKAKETMGRCVAMNPSDEELVRIRGLVRELRRLMAEDGKDGGP